MDLIDSVTKMQEYLPDCFPRVLVPTMGALHKGHVSLIERARKKADKDGLVIVSIFVNPTQFDRKQDLMNYPRSLESDIAICSESGADVVFHPHQSDIYSSDHSIEIMESSLSQSLCGASRPGHFKGVCLICTKLFQITSASHAIFGKKDFQQLAILKRLIRDLNFNIQLISAETLREDSGLAISSRNQILTAEQLSDAPILFSALKQAKKEHNRGITKSELLIASVRKHFSQCGIEPKIDYLEIVHSETLQVIEDTSKGPAVIAIAAFFGDVRLIDHIDLTN